MSDLADFVRAHDPDRFLCALFAPAPRRPALFALLALNHELARAREAASNPLAAMIRVQWWREAVQEADAGKPARRHEVAAPLHAAITARELDPADLLALADAREAEMDEEGFASRGAFEAWLRGTAGGVAVAAGRLLGAPSAALPVLQALGALYGLAGVLRSIPFHAAQGRCLLPEDLLAAAGSDAGAVIGDPEAGSPVARAMAVEGLERLAEARRAARRVVPSNAVAAALPAVLAGRDLRRIGRGGRPAPHRGFGDRLAVTLAGLTGRI
jgi:phytoene synthase